MPTLAALILLLTAPAPVDRSTPLVEIEAARPAEADPAPAIAAPPPEPPTTADGGIPTPLPPTTLALDPTPMPVPPPPRPTRPDRPIRWRVDIVANIGGTVLGDRAWRAFDDNRHALQPGLSLRADTRVGRGKLFLGGGASYRSFGGSGSLYDNPWTYARVREPLLFARLAVAAVEGVDIFAQVGGGPSIVDLEFSATQYATQRSVAAMIDGQGGLAVYLPKRWLRRRGASRVTGGIELAAGYTWRSPVDVRPKVDAQTDPIPISGAALGDLSLRGFVWRLGLFVRFQ